MSYFPKLHPRKVKMRNPVPDASCNATLFLFSIEKPMLTGLFHFFCLLLICSWLIFLRSEELLNVLIAGCDLSWTSNTSMYASPDQLTRRAIPWKIVPFYQLRPSYISLQPRSPEICETSEPRSVQLPP